MVSDSFRPHGLQHARLPPYHPLPELAQTHVHQVGDATQNHLILCHPLLLLPSTFPSIRVFSNGWTLHIRGWKYWSFSFSISPYNEDSGLISFRIHWFDLLAVQGILKSPLQHHSSKSSVLWRLAFFSVKFSHLYVTTGKAIPLTRKTFVGKAMSLLINMLYRFVIAFLPRSKSFDFMAAVTFYSDFGAQEDTVTVSIVSLSICHEVMGLDAMIFIFRMLSLSQLFHSPLWLSSRGSLVSLHFLP